MYKNVITDCICDWFINEIYTQYLFFMMYRLTKKEFFDIQRLRAGMKPTCQNLYGKTYLSSMNLKVGNIKIFYTNNF